MTTVSYTNLRTNLKENLDSVSKDSEPRMVVIPNWDNVVFISYKDYSWLIETAYLLSTKANRDSLEESIQQLKDWKVVNLSL